MPSSHSPSGALWPDLGVVPLEQLATARLVAHYAAQPLAAAAYALLPQRDDHSHSNLLWAEDLRMFVGRRLPGGARGFLDIARLRIGCLLEDGETLAVELEGMSLSEAFQGMADLLQEAGETRPVGGLDLPSYDLPPAPIATGSRFDPSPAPLAELQAWFRLGAHTLTGLSRSSLRGVEVRGWPHHFDLAALLELVHPGEDEAHASINAGLSPGDGSYAEPYFYVSPWPYPDPERLPALPEPGHWHTEGFTAAIFTSTALRSARLEAGDLDAILSSTVDRCLTARP